MNYNGANVLTVLYTPKHNELSQTWSASGSPFPSSRKSYSTTRLRLSTNLWYCEHPAHCKEMSEASMDSYRDSTHLNFESDTLNVSYASKSDWK